MIQTVGCSCRAILGEQMRLKTEVALFRAKHVIAMIENG
jgi:hypothetical protein